MEEKQNLDSVKELDEFKEQVEIDLSEVIKEYVTPLFDELHNSLTEICNQFNKIIANERDSRIKESAELVTTITTLWGIVNESNVREAALESLMIKKGMNLEELDKELLELKKSLMETGQWTELPMPKPKS